MSIFSKSKEKGELALVFGIGSSSVGGALFYVEKSGVPKIIFSAREPILVLNQVDIDQLLSLTMKSLSVVSNKIFSSGLGTPSKIFCVLSSPWYASQTRTIKLEKNTPFVFSTKLADSLIQKEIGLFKQEHKENYSYANSNVLPIELKNMKIMLNGYATSKPLDQKAKELEMIIFVSMSSEQFLKKVEESIHQHFHHQDIKFSSLVMVSFAVARDLFIHEDSFLLVDIGGEMTDISMIKKEVLRESVSFPMGRNFITRSIAGALNCSLDEAQSLFFTYKDGHASEATNKILEPVVNKLKTEWLQKFQESLANLSKDISIPATIFITVNQDLADFFSETIKTEQFTQYTLTDSKFKVIFLGTQALHGAATFEENITRDSFTIMEVIYINRFLY